jgi:hypothetical protein
MLHSAPKSFLKQPSGPDSGQGFRECLLTLVSSRGCPCSALPPAWYPPHLEQSLLFSCPNDPVLACPSFSSCFRPPECTSVCPPCYSLTFHITSCPSVLNHPHTQSQGDALWAVTQDKSEGMEESHPGSNTYQQHGLSPHWYPF